MQCESEQLSVGELQKAKQAAHDMCCIAACEFPVDSANHMLCCRPAKPSLATTVDAVSSYLCPFPGQTLLLQCLLCQFSHVLHMSCSLLQLPLTFCTSKDRSDDSNEKGRSSFKAAHLLGSQLMHNIQELLQVAPLKGYCCIRTGQNSHEMVHRRLQVSRVSEGAA